MASPPPASVFSSVKWVIVRFKGANGQRAFSKDITRVPFAVTPGDHEDKEWVPRGCLKAPGEGEEELWELQSYSQEPLVLTEKLSHPYWDIRPLTVPCPQLPVLGQSLG